MRPTISSIEASLWPLQNHDFLFVTNTISSASGLISSAQEFANFEWMVILL